MTHLRANEYKYPILAKPSGITYDQHRQNVMSEGALLTEKTPFVFQKYRERTGTDLGIQLNIACKHHDDGKKISHKWQSACQKDYENFLNWLSKNKDKSYAEYAKKEDCGENIRKAGVRHEFYSLLPTLKNNLSISLQAAIAAHHGKLGFNFEDRWQKDNNVIDFWKKFRIKSNQIIEQNSLEIIANTQYEFAGIRGLLRLADHRASAKESGDFVPEISNFKYTFPHKEKRGVQTLIEQRWKDDLLLVRAPTGAGKTDAALLWASLQIKNRRADRLVIAMPTRFTSNALAINVSESLSDTGLYHSSAWFTKFQEQIDGNLITKKEADKIHEFARLLQTPVTVCTIDHLLMALTLSREDHHLITFNLANACLVIDEADFYDDFTQANILVLLEILKYWKAPVLLMSASLPESVLPSYQNLGYQIDKILEDTSDNQRIRFEIKDIRRYADFSEIYDLLNLCIEKETAIIYVNTVDKAIMLYDWFVNNSDIKPVVYHSRFTESHKKDKEAELIAALGKEAWKEGNAKGIAILTQIGEMSINISADIMISELCPIDRLTQRAGRLCRFDKLKIGQLYILIPVNDGVIYPAPYGEYNMKEKRWMPFDAFTKTENIVETTSYNADKLVLLLNTVYANQNSFSAKAINNAKNLKEYFSCNWLINSKQITNADDTTANFWKSRNIAAQNTVFTESPSTHYFRSHLEYQSWKIQYSIELPVYLIEKGRKLHMVDLHKIKCQDDIENIYIIRNGFYNYDKGVIFNEIDNFL
jgi:CRISPR-associated endonuclease/helicase Cas3